MEWLIFLGIVLFIGLCFNIAKIANPGTDVGVDPALNLITTPKDPPPFPPPDGFRNFKWGMSREEISAKPLLPDDTPESEQIYQLRNEDLKLGEVMLEHISYFFINNKFYKVLLSCEEEDYKGRGYLLELFQAKYGPPTEAIQLDEQRYCFTWQWPDKQVFLSDASVTITCQSLENEKKHDKFEKLSMDAATF